MVGHVLGLGDRHGENIMIDGLTGMHAVVAPPFMACCKCLQAAHTHVQAVYSPNKIGATAAWTCQCHAVRLTD